MPKSQLLDREFLDKLEQKVKEIIPKENFGVSELADTLGMSRSNLHRKVNALTKISVSQYIRLARLQHGKELLQTTSDTVSEVAYKVGFNSPSYFIKCFHDYFGYPPGQVSLTETDDSEKLPELEKSIAVLPFKSLSTDPEKQYLADGVMDAILLHLSKINDLRVISRTSVEQYRDTDKTINNICQELEVSYLLEGSFQKYGNEARLIAELIQPGKENHVWANDYDRNWKDIFKVQSEVAQTVAGELHAVITPEEKQRIEKIPTSDLSAYEAYLRGNQYYYDFSPESFGKAKEFLTGAIEKDLDWAPLYLSLANYWMWSVQWGLELPSVALPIVSENLDKALQLDPDLTDVHHLKGWIALVSEWNWAKAEREFLTALAINPNDANSRIFYAHLLCILHRNNEALPQAKLALELDPLNPTIQILYSTTQLFVNWCDADYSQVEKQLAENPQNIGANYVLGVKAFYCGDYETVIHTEKIIMQTLLGDGFDEQMWYEIERIFLEEGYIEAYRRIVPIWENIYDASNVSPMEYAVSYLKAKQYDKVLEMLEKGYLIRDHTMPYIVTRAYNLEPLFDNPRFIDIVEKMNLSLPPAQ